jgi:glycosyltransferase involved in cell wall biosynthesis
MPGVHLSATVMTHDSLATLPGCLSRLDFCDEIVVVDDFSSDGTWEWLNTQSNPRLKLFQNRFRHFSEQRQFLQSKAQGKWLLIIDADEEVTPELGAEIVRATQSDRDVAGYAITLRNFAPPYWSTRPYFDITQKRLLRADRVSWPDTESVHAHAEIRGVLGKLEGLVHHYTWDSGLHFLRKQVTYGRSVAAEQHARGNAGGLAKAVLHGSAAFFKYYLGKGLLRFGSAGVFVALGLSAQHFFKYFLLWDRNQGLPLTERGDVPGEKRAP